MDYLLSEYAKTTVRERDIARTWLDAAMNQPDLQLPHESDPALQYVFKRIPEFGNRVLRVVYNRIKEPPVIVTAYFDRTMKGKP